MSRSSNDAAEAREDAGTEAGSGDAETGSAAVAHAVAAFEEGEPALVHDAADREGEVDLVYPAGAVTPDAVARLRNDAGGLLCVALSADVCEAFELPFLADAVDHPAVGGEPGYDDRSSFSLTVNHRDTYTGVTDRDRARTVAALGDVAAAPTETAFAEEFRVPGHVHLLRAADGGLADRRGHTELGLALAEAAGRAPAVIVAEMLDDDTGEALPVAEARAYARRNGLAFVEGRAVVADLA